MWRLMQTDDRNEKDEWNYTDSSFILIQLSIVIEERQFISTFFFVIFNTFISTQSRFLYSFFFEKILIELLQFSVRVIEANLV